MKRLNIVLLSILSLFVTLYLAFLFVLPYSIDLNKYSPQITKIIQENTGFQVELKGLKIKTAWNLSAGALIDKTDLKYPTGKKFAQINNLQIKLSLLPLFFKEIKIKKISADKVLLNLESDDKDEFLLKNYSNENSAKNHSFSLKYSDNMPDFYVKKYRISIIHENDNYSVKGDNLNISDFVLNKQFKIKTSGDLFLNGRKQITYNFSIHSKVFPKTKAQTTNIIKIFEDLYKYNINANIGADLTIKDNKEGNETDINGKIDLDKISFTFGNKIFPQSNLKLIFNGDKAKINASLHVDKNSKAIITGFFKTGKNKSIDLHVISDKINIEDILLIVKAMSKPFGINDFHNISAKGLLKADFNVKSDFKKIKSSGYLKIKNANITNKLYKVLLSSVNADIDFSQDSVHIKQANANLNGQPIIIKGTIDKKAIADISVLAENLQLKSVLLALGKTQILKENDILAGEVDIKGTLKGRLDKASGKVNVIVNNANLKNKQTKTQIKLVKAVLSTNENNGTGKLTDLKIYPSNSNNYSVISAPTVSLNFNKKDLNIEKTYLYIDNIKANLSGKISNIDSNPVLNPVTISIPNQISVPIKGYAKSKIVLKGTMNLNGNLNAPQIQGSFNIPMINIPSMSMIIQNTTLKFDKVITINCPNLKIANSLMRLNAEINKDISKGFIAKNVNFIADNIDLNTITPLFKNLPNNSNSNLTILNGKGTIAKFRVGGITSSNVTSDITLKNNVLHLNNVLSDAYYGKVAGDISYELANNQIRLNLQGRNLSANPALIGLTGRNDDINGKLDFDSNISLSGTFKNELLKSLKGNTNFVISDGKMGVLGKFEHLLYAQNIISNNVFKATLNVIAKAITVKNTGVYKYMKGKIAFSNGWANISWVKTSGPSMSLYITGRCYLPDNTANLIILGRISNDVVRVLGPIGEFSMDKAISYIPKIGEITALFASKYTTNPNYENISQIPYLTPKTELPTKDFKVIIDGDIRKQNSVKSFKWLSSPTVVQPSQPQNIIYSQTPATPTPAIPDFVKNLPDLK